MITTKLILQSILGIGAIAGTLGGSYMLMGDLEEYLLVTSVSETTTSNKAANELWTKPVINVTADATSETEKPEELTDKNYQCQISTQSDHKDNDCELLSIIFDNTNKTAYLTQTLTNINKTNKPKQTDLTAKNFFLLKVIDSKYNDLINDTGTNNTIKLLSSKEDGKSYATLTVHAKISNTSKVDGKTDLAIIKAKKANVGTAPASGSTTTYKCKFVGEEDSQAQDCIVSTLTQPKTEPKNNNFNLSSLTIPTTQTTSLTVTENDFYIVKWTQKQDMTKVKDKVVVFIEETTSGTHIIKKISEFSIEAFVFANTDTSNKSFFILK